MYRYNIGVRLNVTEQNAHFEGPDEPDNLAAWDPFSRRHYPVSVGKVALFGWAGIIICFALRHESDNPNTVRLAVWMR